MMYRVLFSMRILLTERLSALNQYALRRGQDPEKGGSTLEWVIIAAVVFLLAIAAGAKITQVVNEQLDKIG